MRRFTEPVKCSICGGDGLANPHDALSWFGLQHSDPSVCAKNLKCRVEKLKTLLAQAEADLAAARQEMDALRFEKGSGTTPYNALYGTGELRLCRL